MAGKLDGQHAFLTGGGSGIGLACARVFAADGARVSILGRSREKLDRAVEELRKLGEVDAYPADVGSEAEVQGAVESADARAPLTVAVANAGVGGLAPLAFTEDADWQRILQTNLTGVVLSVDGGHHLRRGANYEPFSRAMFGDDITEGRY